jgi:selenocysteine lyase/cysteine desulfurase
MLTRRAFIGSITLPAAAAAAGVSLAPAALGRLSPRMLEELANAPGSPEEIASNEDYWATVQQAFTADRSIINFNNGGVSPAPRIVQEAHKRHLDFANTATAWALWKIQEPQREPVRERVARHWGVDPEEIAFTRNSSESLQICQQGLELKKGDEVLTTTQDYPRMITTFKQRARREEIALKQFKIPIPCEDPATIVRLFEENVTPRTRLILMSHIINITGQILPVKAVVEMARTRNGGIPVVVDGAHALAHFDFKISDLGCDYYGVSLHKWLQAPVGTGLLYVRRGRIKDLWPLMAAEEKQDSDIRKFEEIGTHPAGPYLAIADALTFHQAIGGARKEARLRFLRDRWARRLLEFAPPAAAAGGGTRKIQLHTSLKPQFSCGIGTVQVEGIDSAKIADYLWDKHRILVVAIKHDEFEGLRVTPSIYSTLEEVDRFCEVMEGVLAKGLPT